MNARFNLAALRVGAAGVALATGLALAMPAVAQDGTVQGRVSDQQAGAFFAGAEVVIVELNRRAVTGSDGRYVFTGVPAGTYTLRTLYVGAAPVDTRITVAGDTRADVRLGDDVTVLDNILVIGQRANLSSALNQKRNAGNVISSVTSDFVGQFPDQNVTEAAQRIPGVSINRDQGEGRFISIRGANPNLNAVTINGIGVPSAEGDQRQVALDVIPSELIDTLTVTKSLTPDLDGDSIGGAINVESATAFDRAGFAANLTAEGSYNELRDEISPRISGSASDIFDVGTGQLGIAGSFSYFDRELGSDGVENGDGELDDFDGTAFPVTVEPRDYVLARTRLGAALNFDWRPNDNTDLYLRTFYSDFADDEVQGGTLFEPNTEDGDNVVSAEGNTLLLANQEVESYVSDRKETQTILSLAAGGESRFGDTTVEYQLAYSEAGEENPDYMEFIFIGDFSDTGALIGTNLDDPRRPLIVTDSPDVFNDGSLYELDEAIFESGVTEDREWSGRFDVRHDMSFGANPGHLKFGGKARLREKNADLDITVYGGADQDFTVADFLNPDIDYPLGLIAPQADPRAVAAAIRANQAAFDDDLDEEGSFIDSNVEDYDVQEDVYAGYGLINVEIGDLTLIAGARVEHTEYEASGNQITLDEEAGTLDLVPINVEDSYTDVLPSVNARYALNDEVILRAAYFRSAVRPILEQNRPAGLVEINDEGEIEAEFGNVDLERFKADSFDLAVEYYPGDVGLLSAGLFYKSIQNPVFGIDLAGTEGFEGFDAYSTFVNGDDATIFGVELAWQQDLTFLPAPLDGLLISTNYTFADAEAALPLPDGGSRDVDLPFQARHTANFSLGYEKYGFSGRVAVSYRDRILDSIEDPSDPDFDVYIDDHVQVDVTVAYQIKPTLQVFVEGTNLNDRPLYSYSGTRDVNVQFEEYKPSWTVGLKAVF